MVIFKSNFEDVSKNTYYYDAVGIAKALGITTGDGKNNFHPADYITRQEMMTLTNRALEIKGIVDKEIDTSILDTFADKNLISSYATASIARLMDEGLIKGSDNKINPLSNTTRAEAAVFLYRIYNKY